MAQKRLRLLAVPLLLSALSSCFLFPSASLSAPATASGSAAADPSLPSSPSPQLLAFAVTATAGGHVEGTASGSYPLDTEISILAVPDADYVFAGFYDADAVAVSDQPAYAFALTETVALTARFAYRTPVDPTRQSYQHAFKKNDFSAAGGTTAAINGLSWSYSPFAYLGGNSKGVQIGSANSPQTAAWTMTAVFPENATLVSYAVGLSTAASGAGRYEVAFGSHEKSGTFATADVAEYGEADIEIPASSFALTLTATASKALYLSTVAFVVQLADPANTLLALKTDASIQRDPVTPGINGIPLPTYQPVTKEEYYAGVDLDRSGTELVAALNGLVGAVGQTSYGVAKQLLLYTDENPMAPGYDLGMWDGDRIPAEWDEGASWQREHVWAFSHLQLTPLARPGETTTNIATDLHNLRVACPASNAYHSNKFFDDVNTANTLYPNITAGLAGSHAFTGDFRGDAARIVFYMYTRYPGLRLNDELDPDDLVSMGRLSLLLAWNHDDPVDAFELQRNERIYGYQGNRNPFVDYPALADKIWE